MVFLFLPCNYSYETLNFPNLELSVFLLVIYCSNFWFISRRARTVLDFIIFCLLFLIVFLSTRMQKSQNYTLSMTPWMTQTQSSNNAVIDENSITNAYLLTIGKFISESNIIYIYWLVYLFIVIFIYFGVVKYDRNFMASRKMETDMIIDRCEQKVSSTKVN